MAPKEDGAGYLFAVKPRNESFESHRKEERECRVRICSSHLSSRGIASAMKGPSPSPLVSLDLGHGHFWYNGVWVVWASGPGGGPLSLHDDITVISTKHAETRREGRETSPQLSLQRRSRAHHSRHARFGGQPWRKSSWLLMSLRDKSELKASSMGIHA